MLQYQNHYILWDGNIAIYGKKCRFNTFSESIQIGWIFLFMNSVSKFYDKTIRCQYQGAKMLLIKQYVSVTWTKTVPDYRIHVMREIILFFLSKIDPIIACGLLSCYSVVTILFEQISN